MNASVKIGWYLWQTWLKPGGRLLITDYCCGTDAWAEDFEKYVKQRGYYLMDVQSYGKVSYNRQLQLDDRALIVLVVEDLYLSQNVVGRPMD